jgi:hypothetical protein
MKIDIILLANVFENFIQVSKKAYGLCPTNFVSLPGYTWQCGLKTTNIKLEVIKDIDKILLIESGIRGGVSQVMGDRHVEANENRKILYVDANNLYGWAMSKALPYGEFKWDNTISIEQILNTHIDNDIGYFVECDLHYPNHIKFRTKNFPFCPIKRKPTKEELSDYQLALLPKDREGNPKVPSYEKLICDHNDKTRYLVHYEMLKFYIIMGMKITKVHRVLSFKQSKWLEPYISQNTEKRKQATNDFEKDFYKLLNNAFYGKTLENVRGRVNIDFIGDDEKDKILKRQSKPTFIKSTQFDNFGAYHFSKEFQQMDKPIYIGFAVLELSKLLMYRFYYDTLQPYFGEKNIQLHYMDTDSFVLSVKTDNLEKDLSELKDGFDFSNLDRDSSLYDTTNKKVIGKFKIETGPYLDMEEFVALKAKCYSYTVNGEGCSKFKCINKHAVKKMKTEEFKDCLYNGKTMTKTNYSLRSYKHDMKFTKTNKKGLDPYDDKMYYLDEVNCIPHDKSKYIEGMHVIDDLIRFFTPKYKLEEHLE